MPVRALKVLVVIATAQRAVVHELQSDMNRHTVIASHDIPIFSYMIQDTFLEELVSHKVLRRWRPQKNSR